MRIGIDLYSFIPGKNFGVGPTNYAYSLVNHLLKTNTGHFFVLFTNKDNEDFFKDGPNCKVIRSKMPPSKGLLRIIHEQVILPLYFRREKLDLIHFTGNVISFVLFKHAVFTVHDQMWKFYIKSGWVPFYKRLYYSMLCPISIGLARRIIVMSQFVKDELLNDYRIPAQKIVVIPPAQYVPDLVVSPEKEAELKREFGAGYLFTVTTTWPHKNLITLLKAYAVLKKAGFDRRLIIIGQNRLSNKEINAFMKANPQLQGSIKFLGYVPDETVKYLYCHAGVFIFPSLYEGFGVPPLEAMKFGVATVVARAASLPEVVGDAGLYADPQSAEDFAAKIKEILDNSILREKMISLGKDRERAFSWPHSAQKTLEVYNGFKK